MKFFGVFEHGIGVALGVFLVLFVFQGCSGLKDAEKKDDADDDKDEESAYIKFWKQFGKNIKLGLIEDSSNRTKLSKLLRFKTSKSGDKFVSLEQYVANMPEWQDNIYYIAGDGQDAVENSPFMEKCREKDVEVLYLTDPIDEYAIQNLTEFDGKKLQSITKEGLKFGDDDEADKKREKIYKENFKPLTDWMKDLYNDKVDKITISPRLASSPAILVTGQYSYSANMERIMKSQAFADTKRSAFLMSKKTMEINPRHPIVVKLNEIAGDDDKDDNAEAQNLAWLLFETASLNSGFQLEDPASFSQRMYNLMKTGLSLDSLDLVDEVEVPEEDEAEEEDDDAEDLDDEDEDEGDEEGEDDEDEDEDGEGAAKDEL